MSRETIMNIRDVLIKGTEKFGIKLSDDQIDKLMHYAELLNYFNEITNITSISDEKEIVIKHFLDSLIPISFESLKNKKIIDIGSGAGLPGIPIKIFYGNEIEITMLDSSMKKSSILKKICEKLELDNIEIINKTAEELGRIDFYREKFDAALIRAVGSISTIIEYSIPLLTISGHAILYKGPNVDKEVENSKNAEEILKSEIIKNIEFIIPFSDYKRRIIIVEKKGETNNLYPRRPGVPRKRPL